MSPKTRARTTISFINNQGLSLVMINDRNEDVHDKLVYDGVWHDNCKKNNRNNRV